MLSAFSITWEKTIASARPKWFLSLSSPAWSLLSLTACWSGLQANFWMKMVLGKKFQCLAVLVFPPISLRYLGSTLLHFFRRHDSPLFDFIESCLRNKHELVIYEAASAIVNMPNCTARELAPAVSGVCCVLCAFKKFICLQYDCSGFFNEEIDIIK